MLTRLIFATFSKNQQPDIKCLTSRTQKNIFQHAIFPTRTRSNGGKIPSRLFCLLKEIFENFWKNIFFSGHSSDRVHVHASPLCTLPVLETSGSCYLFILYIFFTTAGTRYNSAPSVNPHFLLFLSPFFWNSFSPFSLSRWLFSTALLGLLTTR